MKKKEIHVLYLVTKLELGGAQKVCLSLFNELNKDGHHALLVSGKEGTLVEKIVESNNIHLLDTFKREISFSGLWLEVKNFFKLIRLIKQKKQLHPHLIIHTHSTKAGLVGRWAAFFAGVKKRIHTVHGFGFHPYQCKLAWFINYCLEFFTSFITSHYICVSTADAKKGIRLLPNFSKKHSIIRASVDQQKFIPAQKIENKKNKFLFGTISCFKKQKNLFDLLKAFKHCYQQNPQVELELIGDGHLKTAIENWIVNNNLKNNIHLLGWQDNVAQFMQQWNAFILSSLWEGLPCAIVEARLLKLPVISYNTGGIHDIIVHGENGLLYPPKNWLALADGMTTLINNEQLYENMKKYNDNLNDFGLETMLKMHIQLYKSL